VASAWTWPDSATPHSRSRPDDFDTSSLPDRASYAQALAVLGDQRAIPKLIPLLEDKDPRTVKEARAAILALTMGNVDPTTSIAPGAIDEWSNSNSLRPGTVPPARKQGWPGARELARPATPGTSVDRPRDWPINEQAFWLQEIGMLADKRPFRMLLDC